MATGMDTILYFTRLRMRLFTVAGAEPKRCPGRYLAGVRLTPATSHHSLVTNASLLAA